MDSLKVLNEDLRHSLGKLVCLCRECNKRFDNWFSSCNSCFVCDGELKNKLEEVKKKLNNASVENTSLKEFFKSRNITKFSLSLNLFESLINKEEKLFGFKLGNSLKNYLNSKIKDFIREEFGLEFSNDNWEVKIIIGEDISIVRGDLFVFGYYKKLIPGISQKKWHYPLSMEEAIGKFFSKEFKAKKYFLHASGREDVDVINEGGRPFVLELQKASFFPSFNHLKNLEDKINNYYRGIINIRIEGRVKRSFTTLVSDSHFDKWYRAYLSWNKQRIGEEELYQKLRENAKKLVTTIYQKTPTRVLDRRANKVRRRRVYRIEVGRDKFGIFVDIWGEAGLYIKELISGDNGRTTPNLSLIIGNTLKCSFLIVKNINSYFLRRVFENDRA